MQVADDEIYLVVNAGCREKDLAHINKYLEKFQVCPQFSIITDCSALPQKLIYRRLPVVCSQQARSGLGGPYSYPAACWLRCQHSANGPWKCFAQLGLQHIGAAFVHLQ